LKRQQQQSRLRRPAQGRFWSGWAKANTAVAWPTGTNRGYRLLMFLPVNQFALRRGGNRARWHMHC
jgi:hypothetical protein